MIAGLALILVTAASAAGSRAPNALELARPRMTAIASDVWVAEMAPRTWVLSFTHALGPNVRYPANGLAVDTSEGAVLVDPGWEPAQTEAILAWAKRTLKHPVGLAIVTHSHADRSAGIATLAQAGIPAVGLERTAEILKAKHRPAVRPLPNLAERPWRGPGGIEVRFPGPGHAPDNLVVWVPWSKVLLGGCLVKSVTAKDLGNLEDADVKAWPASVRRVQAAYPEARVVIPGHGTTAGDPLGHTLVLLSR